MPQVWDWFRAYTQSIKNTSDEHLQMLATYEMATLQANDNYRLMLLKQARAIAENLGETCFSLFIAHWITEYYLWTARDYSAALENALEAVLKYRHLKGQSCPVDDRLYINLVEVYSEIDPEGYHKEISDSLAHVEQNIEIDYESRCMMAFRRGLVHARLGEWDAANEQATLCISIADEEDATGYYRTIATFVRCVVAFGQNDMLSLLKLATEGIILARSSFQVVYLAEFLMWRALAQSQDTEQITSASLSYLEATRAAAYDQNALTFAYYNAHSRWFTQKQNFTDAIAVREAQYNLIQNQGRNLDEVELWLDIIALQKIAGQNPEENIQAAHDAISKLKKPEKFRQYLTDLLNN